MVKTDIMPITKLPTSAMTPSVLVCGDPHRADKIARSFDSSQLLSDNREYRAYGGKYEGLPVTVCSHGVGAPGAAIAFEELIEAGAKTIIRVGTCGGLQPDIKDGDLVIASAAVQNTGYGQENFPPGYPASASPFVTMALTRTAEGAGRLPQTGIVITRDVFYESPAAMRHAPDYASLSKINVLAVEMECATLFQISNMHGIQSGAVLSVDGNVLQTSESFDSYAPDRKIVHQAVEDAIDIALKTLVALSK